MRQRQGFLVNARQIIAYAKWYTNNPLRDFIPDYDKKDDFEKDPTPEDIDRESYRPYSQQDITKARLLIRIAKKHPQMLAFGDSLSKALLPNNICGSSYLTNDGFNTGYQSNLGQRGRIARVAPYVIKLSKQTLVSHKQTVALAEKFNRINKRRNTRRAKWNAHCDSTIKKLAERSPKKDIDFGAFLGNHRPSNELIRKEAPRAGMGDDLQDNNFLDLSVGKNGRVYYQGKYSGIYGNIAYWSARKVDPVRIINIKNLPDGPSFKKDVTFKNMVNAIHMKYKHDSFYKNGVHYTDTSYSLSNDKYVIDYIRYANDSYYVNKKVVDKYKGLL